MPGSSPEQPDAWSSLSSPRLRDAKLAVVDSKGHRLCWSDWAKAMVPRSERIAAQRAPVALVAHPTVETLIWLGAALEARRPLLLLHASFPQELQSELEKRAGVGARVSDSGLETLNHEPAEVDPQAQLLVPTSGSSGTPKIVQLSRDNLASAVRASTGHLPLEANDRLLLSLPLAHVGGLNVFLRAVSAGAAVVLERVSWRDPDQVAALAALGVTHASLVPTQLTDLLSNPALPLWKKTLRSLLVGGAPASPALRGAARRAGVPALYTYGMTETCAQICTQDPRDVLSQDARLQQMDSQDVGRPLEGMQIEVREGGSLWVRGPQVMLGYLGESPTKGEWWQTGDRGHWDGRGHLVVEGRIDSVLITGGEKVSPEWLESRLLPLPGVEQVAIAGVADPRWGQRIVACIVWATPAQRSPAEGPLEAAQAQALAAACDSRIPRYAQPKNWLVLPTLPRVASGKLDRRQLERWARTQLGNLAGEKE